MLGVKNGEVFLNSRHPLWGALGITTETLLDMIIFQDQDSFNANRGKAVHGIEQNDAAKKFVETDLCELSDDLTLHLSQFLLDCM